MTLKRENDYSNAISVPKLVENKVSRQILGPLYKKFKIEDGRRWPFRILPRFFKAKTYTIRKSKVLLREKNAHEIVAGSHTIYISVYVGHSF